MASNESQTQKLIGLYRSCECLWNPQSPGYLSGTVQDDAWRKITRGMNSGLTPDQVKLQILALRNYYDAECAAIRQSKLEGYSYEPRHSYFKDMLFLGKVLPEETEEVSFFSQSFTSWHNIIPQSLPASLCNRTNDIKPDYTFYKLILEPEEPSNSREREDGASIEKNSEREVSGNDNTRFYPTAYCVPCKRKKPSCVQRCECTDTESDSSCGCYNPCRPKCVYAQRCGSRTSIGSCQRQFASPGCGSPPIVYNKHRCRYEEPGPKLCCQPRPRYVPKCPPVDVGRDRSCCVNSWKRNNKAVRRRLKAQLEAREARNQACCFKQTVPCDAQEPWNPTCCTSSKERRRSGQDQMNAYSQNGIPQMNNYQQPICAPCMNNNHQDMDYGRYNQQGQEPSSYYDNQQMPDSHPCINNQQMQDSGRYNNNPQGQQLYSNATYYQAQATKTAYYQPQQQLPQSQQQPSILTRPAQQYGNTNYAPYQPGIDYGRSATSDQSNAYGYAVDNNCGQTPAPAQRPLTCLPCSQDGQNCQVPSSRPPDMDNRYLADTCRYSEQPPGIGQQEDDCRCGSVTKRDRQWQPDDVLRNNQPRRCNQNQGRYDDDEQDPQRRRPNDFDQDGDQRPLVTRRIDRVECITRVRSYEYVEDSGRGRGCYDQSPTRGDPRNNVPDRNYEECPAARKQYMAEREVYCPDRNYENCPSPIRRRPDDCDDYPETPSRRVPDMQEPRRMDQTIFSRKPPPECHKKSKRKEYMECKNPDCQATNSPPKNSNYVPEPRACPQPANDLEYVPCPCPPSRQIPRASPYYSQPERVRQDREDRICGKTRPPPRKCDYEDDRRPPTRDTNRSPPEETECECECESEEERIPPPKRRTRDNRSRRPCDDTDNTYGSGPKNRQERGKENREVFEACCTDETCPYYSEIPPCQEPSASPKRKSKKCYDDERPAKNVCRNQSPTRKSPRQRDDTTDCESPKKSLKKMKAPMDCDDCECSSDDNNYDQGRYSRYDRYCEEGSGKRSTREKSGPRRSDRNESYKSNARSQRRYPDIEDDCECCDSYSPKRGKENMNDYMGCGCSSESDDYSKKVSCRGSPTRRAESPPKVPKCKDYKEFDCSRPATRTHSPCRQSKRADVYESECGCSSIAPKRYDNKPSSPRKQDYKSKREDVYNSECDCFCSGDEKKQRNERKSPPRCSPPRYKNDQREQKNENSQYLDSRPEKTTCRRYPDTSQNRTPQTEENNAAKESAFEYCQCECKCVEDTNGTPNGTTKTKLDQAEDVCTCNCGPLSNPYEPQVTQSPKRNPAGDGTPFDDTVGIEALKLPTDSANKPWQAAYKVNIDLPFPEETKLAQAPVDNVPHPSKKKKPRPGSVGPSKKGSSKPKSRAASPTRNSAPSKTHPVETAKKRTTSLSNGRRHAQGGAKRTTDTSAAANSKLLNDINSASYFICKLQDDDNTQQYLIVVPKEPIARCDTPWDDPGQGSWKQLHCQRQFSDFQGVSWVNPASNSVFASPPFHQMEEVSEISSFEMPPGMTDTTMSIVKEYLQQTKMAGLPGLVQSIQPVIPHRKILTTVLAGPKRCHPIDQPSNKPNAAILTENRTVLRMNPLQNTSLAEDKSDVIVLLPPVAGFRPSRNSFDTDAVEVQRIMVRSSDSDVNPRSNPTKPLPPRPPKKPKRKALL
ncbi:hypothetical protein KR054_007789 [Drosophila jambulina]|nr:hypothetical protein KR054_007789 [Drosophila jambulina]